MEADNNQFPEIKIIKCPPPMEGIARAIARVIRPVPDLGITHGDHPNSGAAVMIDAVLEDGREQPKI